MKQGLNFSLPVTLDGVELDTIEKVEFIFKRLSNYQAETIKLESYPGNVILTEDGKFLIPWTSEETYKVPTESKFYMDTRVHLKDTVDMPETSIIPLVMSPTLFSEVE